MAGLVGFKVIGPQKRALGCIKVEQFSTFS